MENCLFCEIANDPTKLIWENDVAAAFKDIHPVAPVHVLVVPKTHIKNLDALSDIDMAGKLVMAVREVVSIFGLIEAHKVLIQGIELDHLHFHVMSDERYKPDAPNKTVA